MLEIPSPHLQTKLARVKGKLACIKVPSGSKTAYFINNPYLLVHFIIYHIFAPAKETIEGDRKSPSSFFKILAMQIQELTQMVEGLLEHDPTYFLVEIKIKPTNNIKIYLDGDTGIPIEKCVSVNRAMYKQVEEKEMYPDGDFSLEVSSPGLGEPLKLHRQYLKNIGRLVEITLLDGSKTEGKLLEVTEDGILVEEVKGKNKKKELVNHTFLFNNIKTTKIQVVF
jgi:ribosome maturation factor RimP